MQKLITRLTRYNITSEINQYIIFFSIILIYGLIIKFPIFFPDSIRYINATFKFQMDVFQPSAYSAIVGLIAPIFGNWSYVIMNTLLGLYSFYFGLTSYNVRNWGFVSSVCLFLSGTILTMFIIMMDIQICFIFLILLGIFKKEKMSILNIVIISILSVYLLIC